MLRIALALTLLSLLATPAALPGRTFTDREGRTIEAELTAATDRTATIKRSDGRTFELALATLSDADQTFVRQWLKAQASRPPEVDLRFRMQSKILESTRSTETAINTKTEHRAYRVVIENKSFEAVPPVSVEYRVFVLGDQHGVDQRSERPMTRTSGRADLTGIPRLAEIEFLTEGVELKESKLRSGWVYADGAKRRIKDELFGLWLRVMHQGKIVAEWSQPDTLPTKETW